MMASCCRLSSASVFSVAGVWLLLVCGGAPRLSSARTLVPTATRAPAAARRSLIVNGDSVDIETYPFYGSLRVSVPDEASIVALLTGTLTGEMPRQADDSLADMATTHTCGSSLIHSNIVLTAAHCVWSDEAGAPTPTALLSVAFNSNSYFAAGDDVQTIGVREVFVHPNYQPSVDPYNEVYSTYANDLAVLILSEPVVNGTVIDVATAETDAAPGDLAEVIGWGNTIQAPVDIGRAVQAPQHLQHANFTVVSNQKCDSYLSFFSQRSAAGVKAALDQFQAGFLSSFAETPDLLDFMEGRISAQVQEAKEQLDADLYVESVTHTTTADKICTADNSAVESKGVCSGDSGGPLFVTRDGKPVLVGAASYVVGCGAGLPDTYSRVSSWESTIQYLIQKHGTTNGEAMA